MSTQHNRPQAGKAFQKVLDANPKTQEALRRAQARLRALATTMSRPEWRQVEAAYRRAWQELAEVMREGLRRAGGGLMARHFRPPKSIEDWEHLALIVEIPLGTVRSGNLTASQIYDCALAWAERQEVKAKLTADSQVAQPDTKEQPWADDAPEYLPLTEARKLIDNRLTLQALSRLCKPNGEIRYMRKGHRCKLHIAEFRRCMEGRQSEPAWAAAYMNWLKGQGSGKIRLFWKCRNSECGHEYPEGANATERCPKCKGQSSITPKTAPKPGRR